MTVPKCASTSVRDWFIAYGGGRHSFRPWWYASALTERMQAIARALELYPEYFTFSFVRNPYRRFLSTYRHANRLAAIRAARAPDHPAHFGAPEQYARLVAELLEDSGTLWGPSSTAWFRDNARRRYGPLGIPLYALEFTFCHARPQVDFLPDCRPERLMGIRRPRPVPLDFIGAVESIDADFQWLRGRFGLPQAPLLHCNAAPDAQASPLQCDAATRRLVEQLYEEDLAFTGCASEDALPTRVPEGKISVAGRPAPSGLNSRLRRARYDFDTLKTALVYRLFRVPVIGKRLRSLFVRVQRMRRPT